MDWAYIAIRFYLFFLSLKYIGCSLTMVGTIEDIYDYNKSNCFQVAYMSCRYINTEVNKLVVSEAFASNSGELKRISVVGNDMVSHDHMDTWQHFDHKVLLTKNKEIILPRPFSLNLRFFNAPFIIRNSIIGAESR